MTNPAKIRELLRKIQTAEVPDKLTFQGLNGLGFKSSNDRPLLRIMKAIGFVSSSGVPTGRWQNYRNKQIAGAALSGGIREHYKDLYKMYPDAHVRDTEALRNFFGTRTKVSPNTLDFMVRTFRTLCEFAELVAAPLAIPLQVEVSPFEIAQHLESHFARKEKPGYTININIQVALPSDAKRETFDALFDSMKKRLID